MRYRLARVRLANAETASGLGLSGGRVSSRVLPRPESNKQRNRRRSQLLLPATLVGGGGLISFFLLLYAHLTSPGLRLS